MSRNTMTRQHFQLIAETIREERASWKRIALRSAANRSAFSKGQVEAVEQALAAITIKFADRLAGTNSGFRRDQFIAATDPATEYRPKPPMGSARSRRAKLAPYSAEETDARMTAAYRGEALNLGTEGEE